jgi:hypothetical protein
MPTILADDRQYNGDCDFRGAVTMASATGVGIVKVLEIEFDVDDITSGSLSSEDIPAGAQILGVAVEMTTALTFVDEATTTGVTLKAGTSGDDDGWFAATQLSGAAGPKYLAAAGALVGCQVAGGAGACELSFAATGGGSPDLAEVEAGEGVVRLSYIAVA